MTQPITDTQKFTYSLTFLDARQQPTAAPAGATIAYSGSNDQVATIDPSTGDVTALLPGAVTFSVLVTLADGTTIGGSDDVTITSGADKTVKMTAGPVTEQA